MPGRRIFSWPRWAGPNVLVASVGAGNAPDSIVLLDVAEPDSARVVETLWRRGDGPDVDARWPLFSPETGVCYFVGVERSRRTLMAIRRGATGRPVEVEGGGQEDGVSGLTLSPGGRYLLFAADRPDQATGNAPR